jgi:hypothetical protein
LTLPCSEQGARTAALLTALDFNSSGVRACATLDYVVRVVADDHVIARAQPTIARRPAAVTYGLRRYFCITATDQYLFMFFDIDRHELSQRAHSLN